jgi:hypothetical protein
MPLVLILVFSETLASGNNGSSFLYAGSCELERLLEKDLASITDGNPVIVESSRNRTVGNVAKSR